MFQTKIKRLLFFFLFLASFCFGQTKVLTKLEIESQTTLAQKHFEDGNFEKSLSLSKNTLKSASTLKNDSLIAISYRIIALNFSSLSEMDKSVLFLKKSLQFAEKLETDLLKIKNLNNLGNIYVFEKEEFEKGIQFYTTGLNLSKKNANMFLQVLIKINLAWAYITINKYDDAYIHLDFVNKNQAKYGDKLDYITIYMLNGMYHSAKNQDKEAKIFFEKAINNKSKIELLDGRDFLYREYAHFLNKTGDYKNAFYYLDQYDTVSEEIYKEEILSKANIVGVNLELDENKRIIDQIENENKLQTQSLKKSDTIDILFITILGVLLLLIFSLFRNNKLRDQSNKTLKLSNEELLLAKDKAEKATQLKTQFVSTITHELRTPLYGVVGITNIIIDEHKELASSPHLNSLKFSAGYLLSLVNDLLQINKIEEKRIVLENMIFNISDEINTISDSLQFIAKKNKNQLKVVIDDNIPESLIGDKLRLSQIFMNLISNALKFTKNGQVTISAKLVKENGTQKFILFEVIDTGLGIAKEDQEKIFEKFVQIERKEGDYQGTGLGLAIVKKLVEIFGGKINLESQEGIGTKFYFTIPFECDEKKRIDIINNIKVDLSEIKSYSILVVEDNKINQIVTKKILQNNNFKCIVVDDGYTAIDLLQTEKFDAILMDINMPIINGFETTKLIRKKGIMIPIIALTAFDRQEVMEQVLSCGMNDVIIKPFEQSKLFQVLSNLIDINS